VKGKIISVNISSEKGEKKHNIGKVRLIKDFGLENDAHAGTEIRQVSLLAKESMERIINLGINVDCGDFAENLTTEGIDLLSLPVGTELKIGKDIIVRVSQIGKKCHSGCAIFKQIGDCVMPKEGIFVEVLTEGEVKVGDMIEVQG
jgi:molybdopterin adenylyltransferase